MPSDRRAPDVDGALSLCFGAFAMPFRPPSVSLLRIRGSSACSSGKRRPVFTLRSCNRSLRRWSIEIPFTLNDPPYRTERCYNALRLASELVKTDPATEVAVFLMANAVSSDPNVPGANGARGDGQPSLGGRCTNYWRQ